MHKFIGAYFMRREAYEMNGFQRFVKRNRIEAAVKSSLVGIGVGLVVFSVLFTLLKYEMLPAELTLVYISLISVGALFVSVIPVLLLVLKSKKALAKSVDEEFGLSEGVRTGVANLGGDSLMVLAQREAVDNKLSAISIPYFSIKSFWIFLLVLVIGVGMLVSAMVHPGVMPPEIEEEQPEAPPPAVDVSDFRILQLKNLIEVVESSYLSDSPKAEVLEELEGLLDEMEKANGAGILKSRVVETIINVDAIVSGYNSFVKIKDVLIGGSEEISMLGEAVGTLTMPMTKVGTAELQKRFSEDSAAEFIPVFKNRLSERLASSGVSETDALYSALIKFAESMAEAGESADGFEMAKDRAFSNLVASVRASLNQQYINQSVGQTVIETLAGIFGLSESDLPELDINESGKYEEEEKEEEDKGGDGGLGTGDTLYGSDDMIYFPEEDRYVTYGEAIDIYYARVSEMIANGQIPEDMRKHIEDYFAALYNGTKTP